MRITTWKRPYGWTFTILYANGVSGAEYIGLNPKTGKHFEWTKSQAEAAGEKYRGVKGDNWENGNMNYVKVDPATGESTKIFRHVRFDG